MAGRLRNLLTRTESGPDLVDQLKALGEAVELCEGRVDPEKLFTARRVVERADRRLTISGNATVVALAGATGWGKSSTFNALSGTVLAVVGVRRPTTAHAMACEDREGSHDTERGDVMDQYPSVALRCREQVALGRRDPQRP